ncbi:MAG: response regulator [Anaerolineae bacterium]|nr:response regulator [Anaerolineae bacterium]
MLSKFDDMLAKWSTRRIGVTVVILSIVFAELIVVGTEYLWHKSIRVESIARAFLIALIISVVMTQAHAAFINRLRRTETALRKSEAENRAILQALPDIMMQLSIDGHILHYHAPKDDDLWHPSEEFINKSIYEVLPHPFADQIMNCIAHAVHTEKMQQHEYQLSYPDGSRDFEARLVKITEDKILIIVRDISTQKAAEATLYAERTLLAERVEERTAALHATNVQLLQALQTRNEFLANINHELRTPLTPILAFADLLQNEHYGPLNNRQKQISANIKKSAQDLLELVNNVLDFSDIEAGKIHLEVEPLNVNDLCLDSLRQIEPAARRKNLRVSSTLDSSIPTIKADPHRVRQMLNHLLQNAIKFTPNGGAIGLEVHNDTITQMVHFSVWDTGIGIDTRYLPQLFQPFSQLQTNLNREYEGSGLGLALVHYLAELHGGSVAVESQVGKGSRFTISLPWNMLPIQAKVDETPVVPLMATKPSKTSRQPLILVAEDNAMNSKVLCHMLNMAGYSTVVAEDGATAIEMTRKHHPDLVLMDIQMPGMNGLEATRRIRADEELHDTPIIAVTALTMPGDRERGLEAGVNHYISKPMDMQQLLRLIADILHSRPGRQPQLPDNDTLLNSPNPTPPARD